MSLGYVLIVELRAQVLMQYFVLFKQPSFLVNWRCFVDLQAALCSIRIIRKVSDLAENLMSPAASLLKEKHHGVLIAGVQLCTDLCKVSASVLEYLRKVLLIMSKIYYQLMAVLIAGLFIEFFLILGFEEHICCTVIFPLSQSFVYFYKSNLFIKVAIKNFLAMVHPILISFCWLCLDNFVIFVNLVFTWELNTSLLYYLCL